MDLAVLNPQNDVYYELVRSFADSDGDGEPGSNGVTANLDYLEEFLCHLVFG